MNFEFIYFLNIIHENKKYILFKNLFNKKNKNKEINPKEKKLSERIIWKFIDNILNILIETQKNKISLHEINSISLIFLPFPKIDNNKEEILKEEKKIISITSKRKSFQNLFSFMKKKSREEF